MTKKLIALLLIAVMAMGLFTGCGSDEPADDQQGGDEMTTLVFGTSADYAPFEFMYPDENGNMVYGGIDVYIAEYMAEYMGVELQIENMAFNNLLTALNKGDFDIVMADIEATPPRKEAADFTIPYLISDATPRFLVKKENADQYKSYADFNGKTIGAQTGTTKLEIIQEIPDVNAVALINVLDLIKEVNYDKVDAILVDGAVALQYEETNDDLVALSFPELGEPAEICCAVAKGDPKGLLPVLNEAIAKMIEEGKVEEFKEKAASYADVWQEVSMPEE